MIYRFCLSVLAALVGAAITGGTASAHPHVWVTVKSELVYAPDGSVTGVRHAWTFDYMFSVFALQGLDSKKKGEYTREELAPLADVNVTSLKEYDFFTYAKANGGKIEFNDPQAGYYLDYNTKDTVLTLYFTLPLKAPVKAKDLSLEVYDREYFVDFSFAEKDPVKLVGAPAQCKLSVARPQEMSAALSQQLSQLGPNQRDPSLTVDCSLRVLAGVDHDVSRRGAHQAYIGSGEHPVRLRVLGEAAIPAGTDIVFHLAAVVSAQAEADYDLGRRVNIRGTDAVIDRCRTL